MSKPVRVLLHVRGGAWIFVLLACGIAGVLVLRSGWFHERVRERIISEIERTTGGRVEMGSFNFDWKRLLVTIEPLVLHGREAIRRASARCASLQSAWVCGSSPRSSVRSIWYRFALDRPEAHVIVYPDGSTNLLIHNIKNWAENLLNFSVLRYQVVDGLVQYDDRKYALNVQGENLQVRMAYRSQWSSVSR